jgi:PTS system nitrogen regulatory IIA component
MQIAEFISPERIVRQSNIASKKRALEVVSGLIAGAQPNLLETEIFDCFLARERLGSTGIGHGVAIPHGRLKSVTHPIGAFVTLDKGVDFDAVDGAPVDLICALVVPIESTEEHLQILASLAALFGDGKVRENMRRAASAEELYMLLTGEEVALHRQEAAPTRRLS